MNPTQRAAAERLVEGPRTSSVLWGRAVIALLRELLAEPVQEPVAWLSTYPGIPLFVTHAAHEHPQSTAVRESYTIPLYAHPPQRKPLTDEQLKQAMSDAGVRVFQPGLLDVLLDAGRAIERAHGITGEPT